ncbi:MAG: hypothetical protein IPK01_07890 [Acidobacteria bacterium]|nr:hypothetical protein [Acidobacteriota bacterium]
MKRVLCLSVLILTAAFAAYSDIAPERTSKPTPAPKSDPVKAYMSIRMDSNTKVATLSIPREKLKQLRAEIEQLDSESDNTAAATGSFSRLQTIVSGAFLSLAFVFGGIWFVRSGRSASRSGKSLVVLAMIGLIGTTATFVYGNAGPPAALRSVSSTLFDKKAFGYWTSAGGSINLTVSESSAVELNVPAPKNWPNDKEKEGNKDNE